MTVDNLSESLAWREIFFEFEYGIQGYRFGYRPFLPLDAQVGEDKVFRVEYFSVLCITRKILARDSTLQPTLFTDSAHK